eukprot:1145909-Pelagomonas_calceolata.AAC.9
MIWLEERELGKVMSAREDVYEEWFVRSGDIVHLKFMGGLERRTTQAEEALPTSIKEKETHGWLRTDFKSF